MRRLLRWYGAGPLNLLCLLACFALAGYAAARLVSSRPLGVAVWFLGAVIGHDLLLVPLYSLADRSALAVVRHRAPGRPAVPWINYVRVPAALSGLLLLVWFPLILRLTTAYHASTTLSPAPYLWHWLAVTGALFLLSAVAFRLRGVPEHAPPPDGPARPVAAADQGRSEVSDDGPARPVVSADQGRSEVSDDGPARPVVAADQGRSGETQGTARDVGAGDEDEHIAGPRTPGDGAGDPADTAAP